MAISFTVIQFAPGGPVEQVIAQLTGQADSADQRLSGGGGDLLGQGGDEGSRYRGAQGLDPELIAKLEKQFGFDKPPLTRFGEMMWNYIRFDFGESFFRNTSVLDLIKDKLPVSISLGVWIMSARPPVLVDLKFNPEGIARILKTAFAGRGSISIADPTSKGRDLSACEYALLWKPDADLFDRAPNLKIIFSGGAGVDSIMTLPGLPDVPIVRFVDRSLTVRMSEWVVMQCLMANGGIEERRASE